MVVYRALYPVTDLGPEIEQDPLFVRPRAMFEEKVDINGQFVDRFCFVGDDD